MAGAHASGVPSNMDYRRTRKCEILAVEAGRREHQADDAACLLPTIHLKTALPFGEELRKQNDADVLCLPYTATPFALTEAARTLSFSDAMVEEDFRFDPATLRSHLITAYPLLIPVYLLQYDADPGADKKPYSVTMVVEASQPQGTVITENVLPLTSRLFRESVSKNSLFDIPEELAGEEFMRVLPWNSPMRESFARATCFSNAKPKDSWKAQLGEWVDDRARAAGAMARYAQLQVSLGQAVDFDDIRVRDVGEAPAFTEYLSKEQNVLFYRHTMERLQHINARTKNAEVEVEVFELSKDGTSKTQNGSSALESVLQSMKEQLSQSEAVMNKHKPEWLKEWEARQKEEAEKEDSDRS
ncbi:uncharacterized protein PHACADRAFT_252658 [Phanerochaete carnosa HHB-10118-sp]|uniref:Uncharacterized protein n=1 Tax=Phanerochaete carnosa (strain HHB-10118-sp) TaxID=650164 RepID=K5W3F0_PHACS|nr:uncharacterized protein PHACADRAFT_252658 [Phanerochaete carnosa HHB-10118-sp]EKM58383.1 hypothetical protein PHACADRAFT_252658 [Phanerochaete carnosa HHB-10118-sp]